MRPDSPGNHPPKCKAPDPDTGYSRDWMQGLIADALVTDLLGAAKRAGRGLAEIRRLRGEDPKFDAAMQEVDDCTRLAAIAQVEAQAAAGDLRAIRALSNLQELLPQSLRSEGQGGLPPHIAAAGLAAQMDALGHPDPFDWHAEERRPRPIQCPRCAKWFDYDPRPWFLKVEAKRAAEQLHQLDVGDGDHQAEDQQPDDFLHPIPPAEPQ